VAASAEAQNLFEADYGSGNIYEFTPDGTQNTFASGLHYPIGLAFNSAGDLFEADYGTGSIYEFAPDGTQTTFASRLHLPLGLAFQGVTLPVPEPSTLALLAIGTTALLLRCCRHRAID
jgi:sugar lactone lactonase YvrE